MPSILKVSKDVLTFDLTRPLGFSAFRVFLPIHRKRIQKSHLRKYAEHNGYSTYGLALVCDPGGHDTVRKVYLKMLFTLKIGKGHTPIRKNMAKGDCTARTI